MATNNSGKEMELYMSEIGFNNVRLTDRDVYKILYLSIIKGLLPSEIEPQFPVSKGTIRNIVKGKSRKECYFAFTEYIENNPREKVMTLFV